MTNKAREEFQQLRRIRIKTMRKARYDSQCSAVGVLTKHGFLTVEDAQFLMPQRRS